MADLISRAAAVRALASSNGDYLDALEQFERLPTIDAIPVEWLRKVRNDDKLTLDDVETIDLLLAWWQREQEAQDG